MLRMHVPHCRLAGLSYQDFAGLPFWECPPCVLSVTSGQFSHQRPLHLMVWHPLHRVPPSRLNSGDLFKHTSMLYAKLWHRRTWLLSNVASACLAPFLPRSLLIIFPFICILLLFHNLPPSMYTVSAAQFAFYAANAASFTWKLLGFSSSWVHLELQSTHTARYTLFCISCRDNRKCSGMLLGQQLVL